MVNEVKFTQEVKDNWLKALKSGKFIQLQDAYKEYANENDSNEKHCCLAVLDIAAKEIYENYQETDWMFIDKVKGQKITWCDLVEINDAPVEDFKPNYENIIPTIEKLKVDGNSVQRKNISSITVD